MENASGLQDLGVELANGKKLCHLDYADELVRLSETAKNAKHAPDRLTRAAAPLAICFAFSRSKVLLQAWKAVVPNLRVDGGELLTTGRFSYDRTRLMKDGNPAVEVSMRISKALTEHAELKNL